MKVSLPARWSVTIIVFMALAGCGGGGGSGRDLDSSERLLQEATASLNAMLRRQADPTSQNLQNLAAKYSQAYTADRFNPQAAFGVGVSAVAHRARIVADMMPPEIAAGPCRTLYWGARLVTPWGLSAPTKASALETLRLAVNAPLALSRLSPPPQYDQLRTALLNLDGALEDSIVALQLPANTVGFSYVIADYHPGVPANATLTVDQADVQSIWPACILYALSSQ